MKVLGVTISRRVLIIALVAFLAYHVMRGSHRGLMPGPRQRSEP